MEDNRVPNPGTPEAVQMGCTCPILDNHHGEGVPMGGKIVFWQNGDCPLHGEIAMGRENIKNKKGDM